MRPDERICLHQRQLQKLKAVDLENESVQDILPLTRRLEAAGLRALPASRVCYDGSWQIRITSGHPSKRLNCLVPLDPSDSRNIAERLKKAEDRFSSHGRALIVRQTPLTPLTLTKRLKEEGFRRFETMTMQLLDLDALDLDDRPDHPPLRDIGHFLDAALRLEGASAALRPGLEEIVRSIKPPCGFFLIEKSVNEPTAAAICVQDDDLAGMFRMPSSDARKDGGMARALLYSALKWAQSRGARQAWLQVAENDEAALTLCQEAGFGLAYSHHYWRRES